MAEERVVAQRILRAHAEESRGQATQLRVQRRDARLRALCGLRANEAGKVLVLLCGRHQAPLAIGTRARAQGEVEPAVHEVDGAKGERERGRRLVAQCAECAEYEIRPGALSTCEQQIGAKLRRCVGDEPPGRDDAVEIHEHRRRRLAPLGLGAHLAVPSVARDEQIYIQRLLSLRLAALVVDDAHDEAVGAIAVGFDGGLVRDSRSALLARLADRRHEVVPACTKPCVIGKATCGNILGIKSLARHATCRPFTHGIANFTEISVEGSVVVTNRGHRIVVEQDVDPRWRSLRRALKAQNLHALGVRAA